MKKGGLPLTLTDTPLTDTLLTDTLLTDTRVTDTFLAETLQAETPRTDLPRLADVETLQTLFDQATAELAELEPALLTMETTLTQLQAEYTTLKAQHQRVLTLKQSLQPLLGLPHANSDKPNSDKSSAKHASQPSTPSATSIKTDSIKADLPTLAYVGQGFSAEVAFHEGNTRLRQRDSVNFEIFRAIVYAGGQATTDQVKQYLIEQNIQQPGSGQGFEHVSLADISARANYLVKKGLIVIERRGVFKSLVGWVG
jgi:hypothetical protein